ncbi:MAG: hypothetical protein WCG08_08295 [Paludibacter sp.]|jgi:hypothetical protein
MHTSETKIMKREYLTPKVECVKLDNEISLVLESDPPVPGNETQNTNTPEYFNKDPFRMA